MCDPVSIISGISAVVGFAAQQQQADQQAQYQAQLVKARNEEISANNTAANAAAIQSYTQLNRKERESQAQTAADLQDLEVEKRNSLGEMLASNLNTGLSLDAIKLDYERQADRYQGIQEQSLQNIGIQTEQEKKQAYATAQNRMNSMDAYIPSPVSYPSPLSLAVGLGSAYAGYATRQAGNTPTFKNSSSGLSTTADWRDGGYYRKVNYGY